jgi:hypothetical protein
MGLSPVGSTEDDGSALKEIKRLRRSSEIYEGGGSFDDQ